MMVLVFIVMLIVLITIYIEQAKNKKSKENYASKKGSEGEYRIKQLLEEIPGLEVLNNIYLPTSYGYSEIDLIALKDNILFVVESKNYSCKVKGSESDTKWDLTYSNGSNYSMYNPIKQNDTHIKVLYSYISKISKIKIKSVIVFSDSSDISGVKHNRGDILLCNERMLKTHILNELNSVEYKVNKSEYNKIYALLQGFCNASNTVKKEHINRVKKYKKRVK